MNKKELLEKEFEQFEPLLEVAREKGTGEFLYNGYRVEYKNDSNERLYITRVNTNDSIKIEVEKDKNNNKSVCYEVDGKELPSENREYLTLGIICEIPQYGGKTKVTYQGMRGFEFKNVIDGYDKSAEEANSLIDGMNQDIQNMERHVLRYESDERYNGVNLETIRFVVKKVEELQEMMTILGIGKKRKEFRLQHLRYIKEELLKEVNKVDQEMSKIESEPEEEK